MSEMALQNNWGKDGLFNTGIETLEYMEKKEI